MQELVISIEGWSCISRMAAFFNALDDREYDRQVAHMAQSGIWHRRGVRLEGREAILATMGERAENHDIRHVMTNTTVHRDGEGSLALECYVTTFRSEIDAVTPPDLTVPVALYRFRATFEPELFLITWLRGEILQRKR